MSKVPLKDIRGFFMLPQVPEGAGYDVYGTPPDGATRYAHPTMMTLLFAVEKHWALIDRRKFGVGNIIVSGGLYFGHKSHRKGLEMDLSSLREDSGHTSVSYFSPTTTAKVRPG
jgi:penicillin-insensitive murein endopeptidase